MEERNISFNPRPKLELNEPNQISNEPNGSFWSFDKMISSALVKILYVLGMLTLIFIGIVLIYQGANSRYGGEILVLSGIGTVILGNIYGELFAKELLLLSKCLKS